MLTLGSRPSLSCKRPLILTIASSSILLAGALAKNPGLLIFGDPDLFLIACRVIPNHLHTVKGINAAFTLTKAGETINISARSNGKINVQSIAEKLKQAKQ
mgnify:CR=1 FL=1